MGRNRRWRAGLALTAGLCAIAITTEAWAEPLFAQMSRCELSADEDIQSHAWGNDPSRRWLKVFFSYAVDGGGPNAADDAVAETDTVEVCWINVADGTHCPWSEGDPDGYDWLVYDSVAKAGADAVVPVVGRVEQRGDTSSLEHYRLAFDWKDPSHAGKVLFVRVRRPQYPDPVPDDSFELDDILGNDGFCPAPTLLADDPVNPQAHFTAYGVSRELFDTPGENPMALLPSSPDPCTDGNQARPGVTNLEGHACVDPALVDWVLQQLHRVDAWQVKYLRNEIAFTPPTWQHGSGGDCNGPCPSLLFFNPLPAGLGAGTVALGMHLPPADDWERPFTTPLAGELAYPAAVLSHEYFHFFQGAWARHHQLGLPHHAASAPFVESAAGVATFACLDDYDSSLPQGLCASASRLGDQERPGNQYLPVPAEPLMHVKGHAGLFWRYAMENFAITVQPGE